jgi:protein-tyrosine phosphatase
MTSDDAMAPPLGRCIGIPSVPTMRDIGGYTTSEVRRVRMGQLYRSTELNHLRGDDLAAFARLGIRTV